MSINPKTYPAISGVKTLKKNDPPIYATKISGRSPELKYQHKGTARSALAHKMTDNSIHWDTVHYVARGMEVYKYNHDSQSYDLIWDSGSELTEACRRGEISTRELIDLIPW